jgi:hypothetical protein
VATHQPAPPDHSTSTDQPPAPEEGAVVESLIAPESEPAAVPKAHSPFGVVLNLFSSIWLGVVLLVILFFYCSIGSALPMVRQMRIFEMTEYEWFVWWPFNLLIALICLNLTVATLRRIRLNMLTLGVWMIHSGIIILALGSVWYFTTKVEGDTPIIRRTVHITTPDGRTGAVAAIPGNQVQIGDWSFMISNVDLHWELLSGEDKGKRVYQVTVAAESPDGTQFMRQLHDGYPQYTEDFIPGEGRAIRTLGRTLVDEDVQMGLELAPQDSFYLQHSWALYLREKGSDRWIERPIRGLPRFNDYIASLEHVWPAPGEKPLKPDPLDVRIPAADPADPLPDVTFTISEYLRYATMETQFLDGGAQLNPAIQVRLSQGPLQGETFNMRAFDPQASSHRNTLGFVWVEDESEFEALRTVVAPMLSISVPGAGIDLEVPIEQTVQMQPDMPFTAIPDTEYAYRINSLQDIPRLDPNDPQSRSLSLAIVDIRRGDEQFRRWVFDDPSMNRDNPMDLRDMHTPALPLDTSIQMRYRPGRRALPVTIVAGPEPQRLRLVFSRTLDEQVVRDLAVNEPVPLRNNIELVVHNYASHARMERRPQIVPRAQRQRSAGVQLSMIRLGVPTGAGVVSRWMDYHVYPFADAGEALRSYRYLPTEATINGRRYELLFSRRQMDLPAPMALDRFEITSHIGGFTGDTSSIRNWTSVVSVQQDDHRWSEPVRLSVNEPIEQGGLWFFQSQWDAPDQPRFAGDVASPGQNYTVLGVGNRHGVYVQLLGCIVSVLGMIYAFYIKPMIKRHRMAEVMAHVRK